MDKKRAQKIRKYIEERMAKQGITSYRQLSDISGVSGSELSTIVTGVRKNPNPKNIEKISIAIGGDLVELLDIAGCLSKDRVKTSLPEGVDPIQNMALLPVIGVIRAGQPIYAEENMIGYEPVNPDTIAGGEYFFLLVRGNSMIDSGIRNKSLALVRKQENVENGEVAVVMVDEENATIKRVFFNDKLNTITLQPDNPDFSPRTYPAQQVRIIGKVVRAIIDPNMMK